MSRLFSTGLGVSLVVFIQKMRISFREGGSTQTSRPEKNPGVRVQRESVVIVNALRTLYGSHHPGHNIWKTYGKCVHVYRFPHHVRSTSLVGSTNEGPRISVRRTV